MDTGVISFTILLASIPIAFSLSSIIVLSSSWKHYRRVYKTLNLMTFRKNGALLCGHVDGHENEFIWFSDINDFKLKNWVYLHNSPYTYPDPYSLYWLLKYKRYFKNIDKSRITKY